MPLVLLDGPGQVQRDVPQSDWLREVIFHSGAAVGYTCRNTGETSLASKDMADSLLVHCGKHGMLVDKHSAAWIKSSELHMSEFHGSELHM